MKILGLTGGIGSGKSTVAKVFNSLQIPVYIADVAAKRLMHTPELMAPISDLFGKDAYLDGLLNRQFIAAQVFEDASLLNQLNAIVHPVVKKDFEKWVLVQRAPYVVKEAAILFETGGDKACDLTLLVTAPKALRIRRVMSRDHSTKEEVESRMSKQWADDRKLALADYVLQNFDLINTVKKTRKIHVKVLRTLVNR